ncbi:MULTISPECIES: hypothetical protein [unclassified Ensifer]|uniref:hypothetical protein n=1 Tax=unclassified Ensifer TaxID=2633371 RepID=UPI0008139007|nr:MULTISPECIES: hypothetical protein [unclassified Ensifer]OCP17387.1 hypothetical protein BC361_07970 [Ensifer sp. LC54]OCP28708.1 hypothetical protein BC363_02390 [Ensifer sp. LC384]
MIAVLRALGLATVLKAAAAALIATAGAYGAGYMHGRSVGTAARDQSALKAQNEGLQQVIETYRKIYGASAERSKADAVELADARRKLEEYQHELQPDAACVLSPDDARQLRDIR